ncbi:MAG TPA: hypothetical protein VKM55_29165 [Candidatus Lokiarchaeia archaeon]|nr:hypothetical protein [Candidatus Lokiarchaeia archaeon]
MSDRSKTNDHQPTSNSVTSILGGGNQSKDVDHAGEDEFFLQRNKSLLFDRQTDLMKTRYM